MKRILFLVLLLVATTGVYGQKFAVKSNLLYDATATINLGVEVGLAKKWSLDLSGNYNGWKFGDEARMKHWLVQPEARYWLCEKFNGHFFGLHAHYADYNVGGLKFLSKNMENHRYQGNLYGAGLSYGYQWLLSDRWSMEPIYFYSAVSVKPKKPLCPKSLKSSKKIRTITKIWNIGRQSENETVYYASAHKLFARKKGRNHRT